MHEQNIRNESIELWHGSSVILPSPEFGKGKRYNDYGLGFYCTQDLELAKEWSCASLDHDGFANHYSLDIKGLKILDLSSSRYSILHWLSVLISNRTFQLSTPVAEQGVEYLHERYPVNTDAYDIIVGYRADDSYFSFAKAFLNNAITIEQLSQAMELGDLGKQIVLKSKTSFSRIRYLGYEIAEASLYYEKKLLRDGSARDKYRQEIRNANINGTYLIDLIREGRR